MKFEDLGLKGPLLKALASRGYENPTPIQVQSIPHLLDGCDLIGTAQTGTGKTASFALPMLQNLSEKQLTGKRNVRGLILAPTRELALQIAENMNIYGKNLDLRHTVIYGGTSQHRQTQILQKGVDIIIATPGRLIDLINQKYINLQFVEMLVLDEADRMFDMGFLPDVKRIASLVPEKRQTILFSATFPKAVMALANEFLVDPVQVKVGEISTPVVKIKQSVYYVDKINKPELLHQILQAGEVQGMLVFTRTKRGADKLMKDMLRRGVKTGVIHGNKSQNDRNKTLSNFRNKNTKVLIATDVASRGIDVNHITHVINFDLPETAETYVHRIGRTGRAGASGSAVSFCSNEEINLMNDVKRHVKTHIEIIASPFGKMNEFAAPKNVNTFSGNNSRPVRRKRYSY